MATAIVDAAAKGPKSPLTVTSFNAIAGAGVEAELSNGHAIIIGSEKMMRERRIETSSFDAQVADAMSEGSGYFFAAVDGSLAAIMIVSDPIKPSTQSAVEHLKQSGYEVALISGDNERTALSLQIAAEYQQRWSMRKYVRMTRQTWYTRSSETDARVAFVGDGLNDAPALTIADVGIAMGTGTDLAIESADVIAMSGDIQNIPRAISLSKAVMLNIKQNLGWAFGYNVLLIPIATGLLKPMTGLSLSPIAAGLAMSLSSFFVVTNALRLRSWR